jgi:hypothetical protein
MPSILLRRDVIVGFLGLRRASAAACRLLLPECCAAGRGVMASGCECTEEAVEVVAEADGEATGFEVAPGELLLTGAAMFLACDVVPVRSAGLGGEWAENWRRGSREG